MKSIFSFQTLLLVFSAGFVGLTLVAVSNLQSDREEEDNKNIYHLASMGKGPKKVNLTLPVTNLQSVFTKSGSGGFVAHFYPVVLKEKGNPEITVFYTDHSGKTLEAPGALSADQFKQGVTNYVQLLKSIGLSKDKIANDFQLSVDNILINTVEEVAVSINLVTQNMHYIHKSCSDKKVMAEKKSTNSKSAAVSADSILCCKCPPACMYNVKSSQSKVVTDIINTSF